MYFIFATLRILAVYRHYWPDATPYARLLKAILEEQVREGHQVDVYCSQPGYNDIQISRQTSKEMINGVSVNRISLLPERKGWRLMRLVNSVLFLARAVWHATVRRRYDLLIANTHPPVLIGFALRIIKRLSGAEFILHAQDIHPEGALLAGDLKSSGLSKLAMAIDAKSCNAALRVVTLSEDMRRTLLDRKGSSASKIVVLNNFALESEHSQADSIDRDESPVFRMLFAGNLGRFQSLERLLNAIQHVPQSVPLELTFMGTGSQLRELRRLAAEQGGARVHFEPFQTPDAAIARMRRADLCIVSLAAEVYRIAYPSKTMTYLAAGCPLLTVVEPESQLAGEVRQNELGYVPTSTSPGDIAKCIEFAWLDRKRWSSAERAELTLRGEMLFGKEQALLTWNRLIHQCAQELGVAAQSLGALPTQIERQAA
ncbi:glycosyltransferase family 4 protein [Bythopirellula polymerisocia]|uniref:Putative glycosyl transferase n=1 Tax=Bythopirellula polymerisocia TaxID=2528003 RepID=A0A5C6CIT1_9BACT|nr:glycosyltransferase family 4 protein [Bythopirellula polymerisocia]TWU24683.1 putative glycosyl transferase [Bythopirellula polymerisocia]